MGISKVFRKIVSGYWVAASMLAPSPVFAASEKAVEWSDMSDLDLRPVFRSYYASGENLFEPTLSDSTFDIVLKDADQRIAKEFRIPNGMENPVRFWLEIYTKYTTEHVVLFDDRHLDMVYEVVDFRELAKTSRNRIAYEITAKKRLEKTLDEYRKAFKKLARNSKPKKPTAFEQSILSAVRKSGHRHSFSELAKNLRTQRGQRDNVIKGLLAADVFFPRMESIFAELNVPVELTRLSLVESSFNLKAVSYAGAVGVWQFMPESGAKLMMINSQLDIDERLSPLKSTVAAAQLLKANRRHLGSWSMAVTAYNHGFRGLVGVPKALRATENAGRVFAGCSKKPISKLGWASRNYYAEFLAILHAETYRHLFYGEAPLTVEQPIVFHSADGRKSALELAVQHHVNLQKFRFLNPDVRNLHKRLPKGFRIALPADRDDLVALTRDSGLKAL